MLMCEEKKKALSCPHISWWQF